VRAVYLSLIKYNPTLCATVKERDFDITKELKFKKKIDFLTAMNDAKKTVNIANNYKDLIDLMQERITNNDYGFMNENKIIGKKRNNLLSYAITHKFNELCSGRKNKPIFEPPFINSSIKRVQKTGLSEIELKKERAKINRIQLKIKKINELVEQNKPRTHQLYYLLCSIAGADTDLKIVKNDEMQTELKHELIQEILKLEINNIEAGASCFDFLYKLPPTNKIEFNTDLENSFDTDLSKSIFNQLTMEQAQNKDPIFLKEYLKFHKVSKRRQELFLKKKQKEQFEFTIIKFD
jgi:hypothetical protein